MPSCGRCHTCGTLLQILLDGEEWCQTCQTYRRYPSHGWSRGACSDAGDPGCPGDPRPRPTPVFDAEGARQKIGQRIRTRLAYSGVPAGTFGRVLRADPGTEASGFTVGIVWELPGRTSPLTDWFTRAEYARALDEV